MGVCAVFFYGKLLPAIGILRCFFFCLFLFMVGRTPHVPMGTFGRPLTSIGLRIFTGRIYRTDALGTMLQTDRRLLFFWWLQKLKPSPKCLTRRHKTATPSQRYGVERERTKKKLSHPTCYFATSDTVGSFGRDEIIKSEPSGFYAFYGALSKEARSFLGVKVVSSNTETPLPPYHHHH